MSSSLTTRSRASARNQSTGVPSQGSGLTLRYRRHYGPSWFAIYNSQGRRGSGETLYSYSEILAFTDLAAATDGAPIRRFWCPHCLARRVYVALKETGRQTRRSLDLLECFNCVTFYAYGLAGRDATETDWYLLQLHELADGRFRFHGGSYPEELPVPANKLRIG